MELCDDYTGCKSAVFVPGTCYIDTAYTGLNPSTTNGIVAMVRNLPAAAVCQDNAQNTDANGITYTLRCDSDTTGTGDSSGNLLVQNFNDGDFTQCEMLCDTTAECGMSNSGSND